METLPSRSTLKAVASAAGVSLSTASRVLSNGSASPQAVTAVRAAARRLGYRPNPIARALRVQSTGTIGFVVPEIRNPFFADLIGAVERRAQEEGLDVLIADSQGDVAHEERRLTTLIDRRVDGLLVVPADGTASAKALKHVQRDIPVVQVDRHVDGLHADHVGIDNQSGILLVLQHLHELGCHSLRFVSAEPRSSTARARMEAFEMGVQRLGALNAHPRILNEYSIGSGRAAVKQMLEEGDLPDAIVCGSDLNAVGALRELQCHGVVVPTSVQVTGFDDIALADLVAPGLTTVRQPVATIAREAVQRLMTRINADDGSLTTSHITPELVVRESTGRGFS